LFSSMKNITTRPQLQLTTPNYHQSSAAVWQPPTSKAAGADCSYDSKVCPTSNNHLGAERVVTWDMPLRSRHMSHADMRG
jgi:hypothetical protein